eukprot:TRINITY_DN9100_c0_g1_i1.p1 TRINITY_DN9100_c0_g1~~TRINITY_DN9100_c0_g1_i1.p1  ORF type:complete len:446 (+),score=152.04 TRINITY_DN9100_c0_g1_i1:90-1427(+)
MNPLTELESISKENGLEFSSEEFAKKLDERDSLSSFREEFLIPKKDLKAHSTEKDAIYLVGNSLGLQPKATRKYVEEELLVWQYQAVEGHFNHPLQRPWLKTDEYLMDQIEKIVGANKGEVVVMNSLSVNNHLMMVPFYRPTAQRRKILIEARSFPSDLYGAQSQLNFHGFDWKEDLIQIKAREGEDNLRTEDILQLIEERGDEIALVMFSGVQYYTGQFFDIKKITEMGHKKGCKVGWDLAHAVGNVDLHLHEWNVDFATWCSYKYLNGGPGTIAGCFVHSMHNDRADLPRFAGWWGHDLSTRFDMNEPQFQPIPGAFGYRLSNPPVLCVAALLASLEIFDKAGIQNLRKKSLLLTTYLYTLLTTHFTSDQIRVLTPKDPFSRGCQLSLYFNQDIVPIFEFLLERGIVTDQRKPNVLRVAPTPLYNSFHDVWSLVQTLKLALPK